MNTKVFFDQIEGTESEYRAAELALEYLLPQIRADPTRWRRHHVTVSDVVRSRKAIEATYIVRLFAEFETALKAYWKHVKKQSTWPRIHVGTLIDNLAARHYVRGEVVTDAHEVRRCRNKLVHEAPTGPVLSLPHCRSCVCRFLSFLPPNW